MLGALIETIRSFLQDSFAAMLCSQLARFKQGDDSTALTECVSP